MKNNQDNKLQEFITHIVALPLIGLTYWWYNHIFFRPILSFWLWVLMAIPVLLLPKWARKILYILLPISLSIQILCWFHVLTFPIIK